MGPTVYYYKRCTCGNGTRTDFDKGCPTHDPAWNTPIECKNCQSLESQLSAAEAEIVDHERWLTEMVQDYRIEHDDNVGSKRKAINRMIHGLRSQLTAAEEELSRLRLSIDEVEVE
jgi:hypothetical protein